MKTRWYIAIAAVVGLVACRDVEELPRPMATTDEDAGSYGQPCRYRAPYCLQNGVAISEADGGCTCWPPCAPSQPVPRCTGWEVCTPLKQKLGDGGAVMLDAGACLPAGAPNAPCSPSPCDEILACARLDGRDGGNTCRYQCNWAEDAGIEDSARRDAIPTTAHCPPGQRCFRMPGDGGVCFVP